MLYSTPVCSAESISFTSVRGCDSKWNTYRVFCWHHACSVGNGLTLTTRPANARLKPHQVWQRYVRFIHIQNDELQTYGEDNRGAEIMDQLPPLLQKLSFTLHVGHHHLQGFAEELQVTLVLVERECQDGNSLRSRFDLEGEHASLDTEQG